MRRLFGVQKQDNDDAVQDIDKAIRSRYPDVTPAEVRNLRNKVLGYVGNGFNEGFDLAMIKRQGNQTILRVLKLIEEDDD
jgi:hypothetical protein